MGGPLVLPKLFAGSIIVQPVLLHVVQSGGRALSGEQLC